MKITVKRDHNASDVTKHDLLKILHENGIKISSITIKDDLFSVYCDENCSADLFFVPKCIEALSIIKCSPVMPPQLRASRTVLLHKLDTIIYENDISSIKNEIERVNNGITIADIYKFPNSRTVKITLNSQQAAETVFHGGLLAFNLVVPPRNISQDKYIELLVCYRCYKLDDHVSSQCDKASDYIICSLCSGVDHSYKNCNCRDRKCVNCDGNHSTLALSCPVRKKIISDKRKSESASYATKVSSNFPKVFENIWHQGTGADNVNTSSPVVNLQDIYSKSVLSLMVATMREKAEPGTFQDVLNELLQGNGLAPFNMCSVPPPVFDVPETYATKQHPDDKNDDCPAESEITNGSPTSNATNASGDAVKQKVRSNKIEVFIKKGIKLNSSNIENYMKEKKAFIVSRMNTDDCLGLLKADIDSAIITELAVNEFNFRIGVESAKSRVTNPRGPTRRNTNVHS